MIRMPRDCSTCGHSFLWHYHYDYDENTGRYMSHPCEHWSGCACKHWTQSCIIPWGQEIPREEGK